MRDSTYCILCLLLCSHNRLRNNVSPVKIVCLHLRSASHTLTKFWIGHVACVLHLCFLVAGLFRVLLGSFCFHRLGKALFATLDCISFATLLSCTSKSLFNRQCLVSDWLQQKKTGLRFSSFRHAVDHLVSSFSGQYRLQVSSSAPSMTWLRNSFLVLDSLDLGEVICLWICLINSFIGLTFNDECFCFVFSQHWICPFGVV